MENGSKKVRFKKEILKGQAYPIKMEAYQDGEAWECSLKWKLPIEGNEFDMALLLERIENGTKLILMEDAEEWMKMFRKEGVVPEFGVFHPSKSWG